MNKPFSSGEIIQAVGIKLAEQEQRIERKLEPFAARIAELEACPIQKGDPGELGFVPPELAEQVKAAIHLLHESPPIEHRNAPPRTAFPLPPSRPSRIERNESGGYTLIYDEPQP